MPHSTLKLQPGVDQNRTLALNEAAISYTQLVRFIPDKQGLGLVQKLGGWTKFFNSTVGSTVRALWAWEDTNNNSYLGVGAQATSVAGDGLSVISNSQRTIITPGNSTQNVAFSAATIAGSPFITITAAGSYVYSTDTVYIQTPISVNGFNNGYILYGLYPATYVDGTNQFIVQASDSLGNSLNADTTTTGGTLPLFTFTSGSNQVKVTLAKNGYQVGDTFTVLISLTAAGVTIYGNYIVYSIVDTNNFNILITQIATSSTTAYLNSNQARYVVYRTPLPLPTSTGYGVGGYGVGGYGTGVAPSNPIIGTPVSSDDWTIDNWGQVMVAGQVNGPIFTWTPNSGVTIGSIIPQAPAVNDGCFVAMPQRQIIAWGSTFTGIKDPLLIRWCDVENYNSWIATVTNQAGSYRLPKGSAIIGCIQGPQQGLVWTDLGVWAMQYSGPPYVYQFNEIGNGCGLVGRKAAASLNGIVYWMGQSQFFKLGGSGVEIIRCPIWDVIFQDLDLTNSSKIRVAANSYFGEIAWHYPTLSSGGEVNAYVKYNTVLDQWDFGSTAASTDAISIARTAWINQSVLGPPIGAGIFGGTAYIYQHETSLDGAGAQNNQPMTSNFQTGYFAISDGEYKVFVDQVWPDMKWGYYNGPQTADLTLTFYVTDYPHATPQTFGPYAFNNQTDFITPRFRGRLMSIELQSNDPASFWRIGATRYRYEQDGKF